MFLRLVIVSFCFNLFSKALKPFTVVKFSQFVIGSIFKDVSNWLNLIRCCVALFIKFCNAAIFWSATAFTDGISDLYSRLFFNSCIVLSACLIAVGLAIGIYDIVPFGEKGFSNKWYPMLAQRLYSILFFPYCSSFAFLASTNPEYQGDPAIFQPFLFNLSCSILISLILWIGSKLNT